MKPKIWTGEQAKEDEKPMPMLSVDDKMRVIAVDGRDGTYVADIAWPEEHGFAAQCKGQLRIKGYSTDWAEWDGEGKFVRLKP